MPKNLTANQQFQLIRNAISERWSMLYKWFSDQTRDIDKECGYPIELTVADYKKIYERGDIAARVLEMYPNECWQDNPDVYETEENEKTAFETAWIDLVKSQNLHSILQRIDILSGLGQYGVLLIGIDDNKKLDTAVEGIDEKGDIIPTETTKERKIRFLRPFDESSVSIKAVEKSQTNPRFGLPTMYSIKFSDPVTMSADPGATSTVDVNVHWTRILHVADNRTDSDVFGQPRLKRVYDRLFDLKKIMGGSGEMFWRGGFPGLSIETQPLNSDETIDFDKEKTKAEIEAYQKGLKRYLALVGMTAKSLAPQIADPTNHMNAHIRLIAMAWGIPWRIFMGAELGQLASEQDITAWNRRVKRRQETYVGPYLIVPFAIRLQGMRVLPPVAEGKSIQVFWPDTHTVTNTDKATVAEKLTNALTKYIQGGGDLMMDPFHFYTLFCKLTDEEANSIIAEVGDALEEDRKMKLAEAELGMEEQKASIAAEKRGGAGNGNANGSTSGSRGSAPRPKASSRR